ncbi:SDR family oxidoreductase [Flavobacterium sp.]|uniref:SDR family oxidoreductase n=1 Tax=Flavobacterium sp. TaxID=239 RepID=UPI0032632E88
MNKILVTGATGQLGGIVVKTLLSKISPQQISVISRKEESMAEMKAKGINTFVGSYENVASLLKAMKGIDMVLLISSGDQGDRMQEHKNIIDTAKKCGVKNIAYTSRALRDRNSLQNELMKDHFNTEDYIKTSGLNYVLFQNALYMEFLQFFVNKDNIEKGIFLPIGDGRAAFTLRADQAEAMANVLLKEDFENKIYQFTNYETYSFFDVANLLTELSGKEIKYTPIELSSFEETMKQRGLTEPVIKKMAGFLLDIKANQEAVVTNDLENKLGRKPTSLKDGLKMLFNL